MFFNKQVGIFFLFDGVPRRFVNCLLAMSNPAALYWKNHKKAYLVYSGADLGFSRRGANFQKNFQNFDDLFFRSTKLIFRALPKHCFAPYFGKIFGAAGKFLKKQSKKPFLGNF